MPNGNISINGNPRKKCGISCSDKGSIVQALSKSNQVVVVIDIMNPRRVIYI